MISPRAHAYLHALPLSWQLAVLDLTNEGRAEGQVPRGEWPDGDRRALADAADGAALEFAVVRDMHRCGVTWF